ncbi:MAG TPA: carbon storage regulator CsrA [Clostridia bacterium]
MLVLTRKKGESIVISDNIEVTVIDVQGDQVRLGIKAPKSVSVHRKEVFLEIQEENKKASMVDSLPPSDVFKKMGGS